MLITGGLVKLALPRMCVVGDGFRQYVTTRESIYAVCTVEPTIESGMMK